MIEPRELSGGIYSRCGSLRQIHDIRADEATHAVISFHTFGFYGQLLLQHTFRRVQAEDTACSIAIGVDLAADKGIMHIQRTVHIVESDDAAHIVATHHDTGYGFDCDGFAVFGKPDGTVIITGDAARVVAGGLPFFHNHVEDRAVIIGQIAGTVLNLRSVLIITYDTACVLLIAGRHAVIDAVFQHYATIISSGNTTHIAQTDDVAGIGGNRYVFVCADRFSDVAAQAACDTAHILCAQHITPSPGGTVVDHSGIAVTDDAAHIVALQQGLFALIIGKATVPARGRRGSVDNALITVAHNAAKVMSVQGVCSASSVLRISPSLLQSNTSARS